jgi:hypothetical protein
MAERMEDARKAAVDAALMKRYGADYLAAARNSRIYKSYFKSAYDDPEKAMLDVGQVLGFRAKSGSLDPILTERYFEVEGPKDEPPYETNYSRVAEQLRQEIMRRELDPRRARKQGGGKLIHYGVVTDLIKDLALAEALESHEQQGKRFIRAHRPVVEEGYPKSTRSQGKPVEGSLLEEDE